MSIISCCLVGLDQFRDLECAWISHPENSECFLLHLKRQKIRFYARIKSYDHLCIQVGLRIVLDELYSYPLLMNIYLRLERFLKNY